jgi:hypothetical protein
MPIVRQAVKPNIPSPWGSGGIALHRKTDHAVIRHSIYPYDISSYITIYHIVGYMAFRLSAVSARGLALLAKLVRTVDNMPVSRHIGVPLFWISDILDIRPSGL